VWFVGGDCYLTGALYNLQLQLSPPHTSFLASIKPANPGSPGKMAVKTQTERPELKGTVGLWWRYALY